MPDPGGGVPPPKSKRKKDVGSQTNLLPPGAEPRRQTGGKCRSCVCGSVLVVAAVVGILATLPVWNGVMDFVQFAFMDSSFRVGSNLMEDLGMEGVVIFKQHDRDGDGSLSLEEFEPLAHRLLNVNETFSYDMPIEEWDEVLTIEADFDPLILSTMTKNLDELPHTGSGLDPLHGLRFWRHPMNSWKNFAAGHFRPFLPLDPYLMEGVGEPFYLIHPMKSLDNGAVLSSNRYLPPPLTQEQDIMIQRFLSMLHQRPFVYSRFGPQGSMAVIRAFNNRFVDIAFRIHAEFQLNEPPFFPFWFTPAQFAGNIIISKDGSKVLYFKMYVPCEKRLNVDMEWLNEPKERENMEVDIGFMPKMELRATRTSVPIMYGGRDMREEYITQTEDYDKSVQQIEWTKEISMERAARLMEMEFYPFKKVEYYNFTDAYKVAAVNNKPVHSIFLWGALDDQSC